MLTCVFTLSFSCFLFIVVIWPLSFTVAADDTALEMFVQKIGFLKYKISAETVHPVESKGSKYFLIEKSLKMVSEY